MGLYDTFLSADETLAIQLKNGRCLMNEYRVGDSVDPTEFRDAYYIGNEGIVTIRGGKVEAVARELPPGNRNLPCFTKWGDPFDPDVDKLEDLNPFAQAFKAL